MFIGEENEGTGDESLTLDAASSVFESLLSDSEDRKDSETPPAQESPAPESDAEAAEPAEAKDESDEPDQPDEPPTEEPEAQTLDPNLKVKVKVDGEELEVTLEEALKGYSRTQDYTRKTQANAEVRKTVEAEQAVLRAERAQTLERYKQLEQLIADLTPKEPDWSALQKEDPARFAAEYAAWDQHQKEVKRLQEERAQAETLVTQDFLQQRQAHLAAETQRMLDAIPVWKDESVAKAEKAKMRDYAKSLGFEDDRISQVDDHRLMVMLRKAMLYDEAQAKKPAVQARIEKVKTAPPGAAGAPKPTVTDTTRALQRLAKTGKPEDAAAAFLTML